MIATTGFVTTLKCTKFVFGRGSDPDPAGGAYSTPPDPLPGVKGPTSKAEGREKGKGKERKGRGGTGPLSKIPGSAPIYSCSRKYYCDHCIKDSLTQLRR